MNKHVYNEDDELEESEGWLSKIKRKMGMDEEYDAQDDGYDEAEVVRRGPSAVRDTRTTTLRVHSPRPSEISVWVAPQSLNDAEAAAEKLKERRAVLINLDRTDEQTARRIVDFISGVTFALDGYYQRIGSKVFLFTPSNTVINVEDDMDAEQRTLFFDQE